jgi:hypothetical protein
MLKTLQQALCSLAVFSRLQDPEFAEEEIGMNPTRAVDEHRPLKGQGVKEGHEFFARREISRSMNATLMIELNPEAWNGHHIWILASGCRPRFTGWSA